MCVSLTPRAEQAAAPMCPGISGLVVAPEHSLAPEPLALPRPSCSLDPCRPLDSHPTAPPVEARRPHLTVMQPEATACGELGSHARCPALLKLRANCRLGVLEARAWELLGGPE